LHATAGLTQFAVVNRGAHVGSFVVISGDRALGRVDGIATGATSSLALRLEAGAYRTSCEAGTSVGGGALVVGPPGPAPRLGQAPDLLSATSTYRAYLRSQVAQLGVASAALRKDVDSGDLAGARAPYLTARLLYSRVKAAARNFGDALLPGVVDLDAAIDPDPSAGVGGLPLIAQGLWSGRTVDLAPAAAALVANVDALRNRFGSMHLDAVSMAAGATRGLGDLSHHELVGRAEPADHLDLVDAQGVVDGSAAVLDALAGALRRRDASLASTVSSRLTGVQRLLAGLRTPSGFPATPTVSADELRRLATAVDGAADAYSQVPAALARPVAG
jgi:iron uptake system component EfeO